MRRVLQTMIDRRRTRIRYQALVLIAFGLVLVYAETQVLEPVGIWATLAGIGLLVLMVRGRFDVEARHVEVVVQALEDIKCDETGLQLLWDDTIAHADMQDMTCARNRMALITLCAIEVLWERRRMRR